MPTFSLISPLEQPLGTRRLLDDLKRCLADPTLSEFGFVVAFAKVGPFYRLQELLQQWRLAGKSANGIFGIDHCGTSVQALDFAINHLDAVYYTQHKGNSFHPKIYWFRGKKKAVAFIGSNNFTMGGMELNFEATVELVFELPAEEKAFAQVHAMYTSILPGSCPATQVLTYTQLNQLESEGLLLDETKKNSGSSTNGKHKVAQAQAKLPRLPVKPMSSLPAKTIFGKPPKKKALAIKAAAITAQAATIDVTKPLVPVSGIAMQIKPHHNGEIFLSRIAAQQNPAFFGIPFTGETTPKKGSNSGYPQRTPDPVCNIIVYGEDNKVLYLNPSYDLNTVFYEAKSEIRVTASPLVPHVPEYSMLIMSPSDELGVDYDMQIFTPSSPDYSKWLAVCDQTMPGGGKVPRKFGWF